MAIEKELLWRAWPDGYLAMRGVQTVGKWICVNDNEEVSRWLPMGGPRWEGDTDWPTEVAALFPEEFKEHQCNDLKYAHEEGDLLPNVDPADPATWACLLHDMAVALGWDDRKYGWGEPAYGPFCTWQPIWQKAPANLEYDACWELRAANHRKSKRFPGIDTDDPALALVLARIQLREQEDSDGNG